MHAGIPAGRFGAVWDVVCVRGARTRRAFTVVLLRACVQSLQHWQRHVLANPDPRRWAVARLAALHLHPGLVLPRLVDVGLPDAEDVWDHANALTVRRGGGGGGAIVVTGALMIMPPPLAFAGGAGR